MYSIHTKLDSKNQEGNRNTECDSGENPFFHLRAD